MPLTRWIISAKTSQSSLAKDAIVNTLYFNVSGVDLDGTGWQDLGDDLWDIWKVRPWAVGRFIDIRGYSMDDPEPRPQKYIRREQLAGGATTGPRQIALCLSYYADRNLPRQRGRIYLGPWNVGAVSASPAQTGDVIALAQPLADLGGLNVDWSLWSPTTQTHTRINHAWVDDSWDVIRSRKVAAVAPRLTWTGNG